MRGDGLLDKMELIDAEYVEAADMQVARKPRNWVKWVAVAACLVVVAVVVAVATTHGNGSDTTQFELNLSDLTTATVTLGVNGTGAASDVKSSIITLTEEEVFARENVWVFRGTIRDLTNITIDFNGWTEVACIATIDVSEVYKGDVRPGEQVTMLLPWPVGLEDYRLNASVAGFIKGIIPWMEVGEEGIFVPYAYDDDSIVEWNGATLDERDLAQCGYGDGTYGLFLFDGEWVHFSSWAHPGVKGAKSLDDVETYVLRMLGE